jgi:manganese efflux pump family protein
VLSLGLDTFAVAIGLGLSGLDRRDRVRYGVSFAVAEGAMPLVGFLIGGAVFGLADRIAPYVAALLLLGVGLYTLWEALSGEEEGNYSPANLMTLLLTALSVSLDELAVGFSLGLLHVPVVLAIVLIAAQALIITYVGTAIGQAVGERVAQRSELLSGGVLTLLAIGLLIEQAHG